MKYRMYFFVPYNISEIQKGIQAGHAALEYAFLYGDTNEYKSFIVNDKTWIILNGGTTRGVNWKSDLGMGSLNEISQALWDNLIPLATFSEPDLNFALTSVCFLADERVWDFESYPDFENVLWEETLATSLGYKRTREFLIQKYPEHYQTWVRDVIGGEKNVFLRELIRNKKLA